MTQGTRRNLVIETLPRYQSSYGGAVVVVVVVATAGRGEGVVVLDQQAGTSLKYLQSTLGTKVVDFCSRSVLSWWVDHLLAKALIRAMRGEQTVTQVTPLDIRYHRSNVPHMARVGVVGRQQYCNEALPRQP